MTKLPIVALSLLAAATLAACGNRPFREAVVSSPTVAVIPGPDVIMLERAPLLRPGFGRVEYVQTVVYSNGAPTGMRRLNLKMDDGSTQVLDTPGPNPAIGQRVEITPERYIRYPLA